MTSSFNSLYQPSQNHLSELMQWGTFYSILSAVYRINTCNILYIHIICSKRCIKHPKNIRFNLNYFCRIVYVVGINMLTSGRFIYNLSCWNHLGYIFIGNRLKGLEIWLFFLFLQENACTLGLVMTIFQHHIFFQKVMQG